MSRSQGGKRPDFKVSPVKPGLESTRSGLLSRDKRIELEKEKQLQQSDLRLAKSFQRVLAQERKKEAEKQRALALRRKKWVSHILEKDYRALRGS